MFFYTCINWKVKASHQINAIFSLAEDITVLLFPTNTSLSIARYRYISKLKKKWVVHSTREKREVLSTVRLFCRTNVKKELEKILQQQPNHKYKENTVILCIKYYYTNYARKFQISHRKKKIYFEFFKGYRFVR